MTTNRVSRSFGTEIVPFDLVVLPSAVPEPSTYALAAFGLLGLGLLGIDCDGYIDINGDILQAFTNFTGPGSFGKTRLQGDVHGPDTATGEVSLDVDDSGIIGYVLKNGASTFIAGNHTTILAGVSTSLAGEISEAAFTSSVGSNSIGFVFPIGMDLAALTAYLTTNEVSTGLGAPVVPFDLVVINASPAVPEPSTLLLSMFGIVALGLFARRRGG